MKGFPRAIWLLSFVSLFNDAASELLYPIMPLYLSSIGYGALAIGLLEGVAEAIGGLTKGYFGAWSDQSGKRAPFVQLGYALGALAKPLLPLSQAVPWVFGLRFADRLGKGVRTAARDAMLSDAAPAGRKGAAFGLHRAMDTLGAVLGPSLALWWLAVHPHTFEPLFYYAAIPGVLAVGTALLLRDAKKETPLPAVRKKGAFSFFGFWQEATPAYRHAVGGLVGFALVNSSDVFLLLRAGQLGFTPVQVIGCYVLYNIVGAVASFPLGHLSDKIGARTTVLGGLVVFALCYAGLGVAYSPWQVVAIFALYGLYAAATDGVAKAWLTQLEPHRSGNASGLFGTLQSLAALVASGLAGWVWSVGGSSYVFYGAALGALLSAAWLALGRQGSGAVAATTRA